MKKLALVHTINWYDRVIIEPFVKPWLQQHPDAEVINIMDDSLLPEAQASDGPTKEVIKRLIFYFQAAEATGADAIMTTCSTMGVGTRIGREFVNIPLFNIDEPMAREALKIGKVFGIVGTFAAGLSSTVSLIKHEAIEAEKSIEIHEALNTEAYEALMQGNVARHDELVREELGKLEKEVDVLILGQSSLAQVAFESSVPLLQVGRSGLDHAAKLLNLRTVPHN